jgi:hypothetical protein
MVDAMSEKMRERREGRKEGENRKGMINEFKFGRVVEKKMI